jgi:hypothetical protein
MNTRRILALGLVLGGLFMVLSPALAENTATSQADLASYVAKFSLKNNSDLSIGYQIKWGNGPWKSFRLEPGQTWDHWADVTNGRYPTPHIKFYNVAGANSTKEYRLEGYDVGYNGYGANPPYSTTPKMYDFSNTVNNNTVDLFSDN